MLENREYGQMQQVAKERPVGDVAMEWSERYVSAAAWRKRC